MENKVIYAKTKNVNSKPFDKNKLIFDDLASAEKKKIKTAKEAVLDDCMLAADKINSIKDKEVFDIGVSEVFDERADDIIGDYKETYEERKNSDNLDYVTDKVIVNFDNDTSTEEINRVADEMGSECYILDEKRA